jgi:hypothetical protein
VPLNGLMGYLSAVEWIYFAWVRLVAYSNRVIKIKATIVPETFYVLCKFFEF